MQDTTSIGILGAGSWGVTLARLLSNKGYGVTVWSALEKEVAEYTLTRRNPNLPYMAIPDNVLFTTDMASACVGKDIIVFAVPSVYVRTTAREAAKHLSDGQVVVDVAKGMEEGTLMTLTQVIDDELSKAGVHARIVALSGPTHAEEVSRDMPTAIVAASADREAAVIVQDIFMDDNLRVYVSGDVFGVELSGALKNIVALAVGISNGLGYGDNARAALITGGMEEIRQLGKAMGCRERTFYGLTGIGDLIVTATSQHSRNNRCGYLIGSGKTPEEAVREVGMVVEGINALPAAMQLKERYHITMHIISAVNAVVNEGLDARQAGRQLMDLVRRPEK
ncbi:MAG: NAD(P)-dependent glycerol-3-phosphate dehydrogenase [Bacteroidales bacterium]|nr:NAD(P)-dependent glycerol-3-phosphate dehydrogenase [Bacteroidales bacterium]